MGTNGRISLFGNDQQYAFEKDFFFLAIVTILRIFRVRNESTESKRAAVGTNIGARKDAGWSPAVRLLR